MSSYRRRTREIAEQREADHLAPAATLSSGSLGRVHSEPPHPSRTVFELDRDRIIHSKAFRRLKHKTQVFINPDGDHYVTRLTHTLQVTEVGRSIAAYLGLNETLTEAICLGHDVGHSPFGHIGEEALSSYADGEWLHSQQSVRVFTVLEPLKLAAETLDGIRAHSWKIEPPPSTAEGMVCRFADRIAYLTHDVADALRAGILQLSDLPSGPAVILGDPGPGWIRTMVEAVVEETLRTQELAMAPPVLAAMHELREFMFQRVYLRDDSEHQKQRTTMILGQLVDHYLLHPDEIPDSYRHAEAGRTIQVLDYVAGMTDRYALRMHAALKPR
ncbi:MAG: HD domain-containing protein [Acidimicrobiia bacterium]